MTTGSITNVDGALRAAARRLDAASPSARLDAELLLAHALGVSRSALYGRLTDSLSPEHAARYAALVDQRLTGRPVAQLTGRRSFWSLELAVDPATLIPRPETEQLVEQALARLAESPDTTVADLGTGSGAIALALASERPAARITATDISPAALAIARANARRLGLTRITFAEGDWYAALHGTRQHMIVSNPPYIADDEWPAHAAGLAFEPEQALRAGTDGLDALRVIVAGAPAHLHAGGWLLLEHGWRQGEAVRTLLAAAGFDSVRTARDAAGHERVTLGQCDTVRALRSRPGPTIALSDPGSRHDRR